MTYFPNARDDLRFDMQFRLKVTGNESLGAEHHSGLWAIMEHMMANSFYKRTL